MGGDNSGFLFPGPGIAINSWDIRLPGFLIFPTGRR